MHILSHSCVYIYTEDRQKEIIPVLNYGKQRKRNDQIFMDKSKVGLLGKKRIGNKEMDIDEKDLAIRVFRGQTLTW